MSNQTSTHIDREDAFRHFITRYGEAIRDLKLTDARFIFDLGWMAGQDFEIKRQTKWLSQCEVNQNASH